MDTLFRKGYLLAGVVMAANMFIVNEMKAMENKKELIGKNIQEEKKKEMSSTQAVNDLATSQPLYVGKNLKKKKKKFLNSFLELENWINLGVGIFSSIANNYLKLWDYNPGTYYKFVWLGWRSKRLLNDIFQFDINLNIGRGCFWAILSAIGIFCECVDKNKKSPKTVAMYLVQNVKKEEGKAYFFITFLQGLISTPLTVHIAKFDFSISLSIDSILWEIVRQVCWRKYPSEEKEDIYGLGDLEKSNIIFHDRRQTNGEK